jgi:hypothetical protein
MILLRRCASAMTFAALLHLHCALKNSYSTIPLSLDLPATSAAGTGAPPAETARALAKKRSRVVHNYAQLAAGDVMNPL